LIGKSKPNIAINVRRSSRKVPDTLPDFNQVPGFSTDIRKKSPISNFTEIRLLEAGLTHRGRKDTEVNLNKKELKPFQH